MNVKKPIKPGIYVTGENNDNGGYIYTPYIPLQITTVGSQNMTNTTGSLTSSGKATFSGGSFYDSNEKENLPDHFEHAIDEILHDLCIYLSEKCLEIGEYAKVYVGCEIITQEKGPQIRHHILIDNNISSGYFENNDKQKFTNYIIIIENDDLIIKPAYSNGVIYKVSLKNDNYKEQVFLKFLSLKIPHNVLTWKQDG